MDLWGVIDEHSDPSAEGSDRNRYRGSSNSRLPFGLLIMFPTVAAHLDAFRDPFRYVDVAASAFVEFCRVRLGGIPRRGS